MKLKFELNGKKYEMDINEKLELPMLQDLGVIREVLPPPSPKKYISDFKLGDVVEFLGPGAAGPPTVVILQSQYASYGEYPRYVLGGLNGNILSLWNAFPQSQTSLLKWINDNDGVITRNVNTPLTPKPPQ